MKVSQIVLSYRAMAALVFVLWVLAPITAWVELGFPTDRTAISLLVVALLSAVGNFIRDLLSGNLQPPPVSSKQNV